MEKKTITLDYQDYLKLDERAKLADSNECYVSVVNYNYNDSLDLTNYFVSTINFIKGSSTVDEPTIVEIQKIIDAHSEGVNEVMASLSLLKESIKKLSGTIEQAGFIKRLSYLFTGKLD